MTQLLSLVAFLETPLGQALVSVVPTLLQDVIGIWHKNGTVSTQDIVDYVSSQKSFDALVPQRA